MWLTGCNSILQTRCPQQLLAKQLPVAARFLLSQWCSAGAQLLMAPSGVHKACLTLCRGSQLDVIQTMQLWQGRSMLLHSARASLMCRYD